MQIDELVRVNQDTERISNGLGRFDTGKYEGLLSEKVSEGDLKRMVHELAQELDKFPRKNRHSLEWFEKYHAKFLQLKEKQVQQERTEEGIKDLLKQLDEQKLRTLEENFRQLNKHFSETFAQIVPSGHGELKLQKADAAQISQKSHPT